MRIHGRREYSEFSTKVSAKGQYLFISSIGRAETACTIPTHQDRMVYGMIHHRHLEAAAIGKITSAAEYHAHITWF